MSMKEEMIEVTIDQSWAPLPVPEKYLFDSDVAKFIRKNNIVIARNLMSKANRPSLLVIKRDGKVTGTANFGNTNSRSVSKLVTGHPRVRRLLTAEPHDFRATAFKDPKDVKPAKKTKRKKKAATPARPVGRPRKQVAAVNDNVDSITVTTKEGIEVKGLSVDQIRDLLFNK